MFNTAHYCTSINQGEVLKSKVGKLRSLRPKSPAMAARSLHPPQHLRERLNQTAAHLDNYMKSDDTDRTEEGKLDGVLPGGVLQGQSVHQGRGPSER